MSISMDAPVATYARFVFIIRSARACSPINDSIRVDSRARFSKTRLLSTGSRVETRYIPGAFWGETGHRHVRFG